MCMTRAVCSRVQCTKARRTGAFCLSHTAWQIAFFLSVCVARSGTSGGGLNCREGNPWRFDSFQKNSSFCCQRLHANVGHPISATTDAFDFVRRLACKIALATESWHLLTCRQPSKMQESRMGPAYSSTGQTRLTLRCLTKVLLPQRKANRFSMYTL